MTDLVLLAVLWLVAGLGLAIAGRAWATRELASDDDAHEDPPDDQGAHGPGEDDKRS